VVGSRTEIFPISLLEALPLGIQLAYPNPLKPLTLTS